MKHNTNGTDYKEVDIFRHIKSNIIEKYGTSRKLI